jgi:hypothetical protein
MAGRNIFFPAGHLFYLPGRVPLFLIPGEFFSHAGPSGDALGGLGDFVPDQKESFHVTEGVWMQAG